MSGQDASCSSRNSEGFSLVEMLVALVFTMILMAGMASVFKSSLSAFVRNNEQLSNFRRNRMSLDMVYDDLNNMGMYLMSLTTYPGNLTSASPGFYVSPNVSYAAAGLDVQGTLPANWSYPASTGDQLYLYFDDPLPYDGTLKTDLSGLATMENAGSALTDTNSFDISFQDANQAAAVKQGMFVIFRDAWDVKKISAVSGISTDAMTGISTVTLDTSGATSTGGYDDASGNPTGATPLSKLGHSINKIVLVVNPAQQVRYSIQTRAFDPSDATKLIPCLVREQGPLGGAFDATKTAVIAENVIGFKAFVSADSGATWAGMGYTTAGSNGSVTPWNDTTSSGKFRKVLDTALSKVTGSATWGRTGFKDTSSPNWFREIPIIVRIDLLTRTMTKRSEYGNQSPTAPTADYGTRVQTLILVPRHTGLPLG
jgi:Tfp pilus assembly protein PilW